MNLKYHNPGEQHNYDSDGKKAVRQQIIDTYRRLSGNAAIPSDRHYWSLCAKPSEKKNCELEQLVGSGLIKNYQFQGVNIDAKIIVDNKNHYPSSGWYNGNWRKIVAKMDQIDLFHPSIVYHDTINEIMSVNGVLTKDHDRILSDFSVAILSAPADCLLVHNRIIKNKTKVNQADYDAIMTQLQQKLYNFLSEKNKKSLTWLEPYWYKSDAGRQTTDMATIMVYKYAA